MENRAPSHKRLTLGGVQPFTQRRHTGKNARVLVAGLVVLFQQVFAKSPVKSRHTEMDVVALSECSHTRSGTKAVWSDSNAGSPLFHAAGPREKIFLPAS